MNTCHAGAYRVILAWLFIACFSVTAFGDDPPASDRPANSRLAEVARRMRPLVKNLPEVSMADRVEIVREVTAAFGAAETNSDGKGVGLNDVPNLLECDKWLTSCDFGDPQAEEVICQRMTLAGLAFADQLRVETEISLIGHLRLGSMRNLNARGEQAVGPAWQALRNQIVVLRLHPYRRLEQTIDPNWDPNDRAYRNFAPPRFVYPSGIAPEAIKEPEIRAAYEAALQINRQKSARYSQQLSSRRLLKSYLSTLRRIFANPYEMPPVTYADVVQLEANLLTYVGDEKVRNELLLAAVCAADKISEELPAEQTPAPEKKLTVAFQSTLDEIKAMADAGYTAGIYGHMELLLEQLHADKLDPVIYVDTARTALYYVFYTQAGQDDQVRESGAKLALDALSATKTTELASVDLVEQKLMVTLGFLRDTGMSPDRVVAESLEVWEAFVATKEHYAPYDPQNPRAELPIPPPPTGYPDWLSVGQSPEANKDPILRRQYYDILSRRIEFMQTGGKYLRLIEVQERFLKVLKMLLYTTYAATPEKVQAGEAVIAKYISNSEVRRELIECLTVKPSNPY